MKIFVTSKTGSRNESIVQGDDLHFLVSVKARPIKGKANAAIIKSIATFFHVPQSAVSLRSGVSSKQKVFDIDLKG